MNVNGVDIEYQYDGAHDARPTEHTLHGLDGLNLLLGLDAPVARMPSHVRTQP